MGLRRTTTCCVLFCALVLVWASYPTSARNLGVNQTAFLNVDASPQSAKKMPDYLFGIFFEVSSAIFLMSRYIDWVLAVNILKIL